MLSSRSRHKSCCVQTLQSFARGTMRLHDMVSATRSAARFSAGQLSTPIDLSYILQAHSRCMQLATVVKLFWSG